MGNGIRVPSVFLLRGSDVGWEVYFGEFSTADGLRLLPEHASVEFLTWHSDPPTLPPKQERVGGLIDFLDGSQAGLVDVTLQIQNQICLSTHDDGECHFKLRSKEEALNLIEQTVPGDVCLSLRATLLEHPGAYVALNGSNEVEVYSSFDDYLSAGV